MASPMRNASPGFMVRSRVNPFRLFSRPSTAVRFAIGVPGRVSFPAVRIGAVSTLTGPV
ncbi:hypothetical protein J3E64_000141 [Sphingobium sp. OAS761]|uniref:hypothetical protein n=1 Tax=Sphingobium sp. OAS761 TaxID=2817901 RepID=UPI0020A0157A|nr:hypothetical protein [Sphingobium sp. OAS761]MCP1468474.1 hypothetical protein [Sphingobium sp. OAS761]